MAKKSIFGRRQNSFTFLLTFAYENSHFWPRLGSPPSRGPFPILSQMVVHYPKWIGPLTLSFHVFLESRRLSPRLQWEDRTNRGFAPLPSQHSHNTRSFCTLLLSLLSASKGLLRRLIVNDKPYTDAVFAKKASFYVWPYVASHPQGWRKGGTRGP